MRFKRSTTTILIAGASVLVAGGLAVAAALQQTSLEDLVSQAQAKADAMKGEAAGLDQSVQTRSQTYTKQAADLSQANAVNIRKGMGMLGPLMPQGGMTPEDAQDDGGVVYVAISLSMPQATLRQLARDTAKAHVNMVLQGPLNGSFVQTYKVLRNVFSEGQVAGMIIDPRVFKQYHIERVPAFISAPEEVPECEQGLDCVRPEVPFDVVKGNISLEAALKILAEKGDAAPQAANAALSRLES